MATGGYNFTKENIESLLSKIRKNETEEARLKRGTILSYGINAHEIIKEIAKNLNRDITTPTYYWDKNTNQKVFDGGVREKTFDELIKEIKEVYFKKSTDRRGNKYFDATREKRNDAAHIFDLNKIGKEDEKAKLEYEDLERWFFEDYLGGKFDETLSTVQNQVDEEKLKLKKIANKVQKRSDRETFFAIGFITLAIFFLSYFMFKCDFLDSGKLENEIAIKEEHDNAFYLTMKDYYNALNTKDYDANKYFASKVQQFVTLKNITADSINKAYASNMEYIGGKSIIQENTIRYDSTNAGISYWHFWADYTCFRKSKNLFQSCATLIRVGIDSVADKFVLYREMEIYPNPPVYSVERP